jgi:hypothetical protein
MIREKTWKSWRQFKESRPGSRFQDRYHRRQHSGHGQLNTGRIINLISRIINLISGIVLVLAGLFMVALPTPAGWILVVVGLVVTAGELEPVARFMDRLEMGVRKVEGWAINFWSRSSTVMRFLSVAALVAVVAALGYGAYYLIFGG